MVAAIILPDNTRYAVPNPDHVLPGLIHHFLAANLAPLLLQQPQLLHKHHHLWPKRRLATAFKEPQESATSSTYTMFARTSEIGFACTPWPLVRVSPRCTHVNITIITGSAEVLSCRILKSVTSGLSTASHLQSLKIMEEPLMLHEFQDITGSDGNQVEKHPSVTVIPRNITTRPSIVS
jgi:hypothetical protein